jgi:multiple sugar transport system substrate-binding protein
MKLLWSRAPRIRPAWLLALGRCSLIIIVLSTGLVGCAGQGAAVSTPAVLQTPTPGSLQPILVTDLPTPTQLAGSPATVKLRIWIPPQLDPASGSEAGEILRQRLDEFTRQRPGVEIQVRVKALSGTGGMLDSLSTTSAAAPLAMPDIVALPRDLLESAALKGLLRPMTNLTEVLNAPDWYDYALQLSRLQESVYGLPFAGDALVLVYRTQNMPAPPVDWEAALKLNSPLVFPAADPLALFTIAQYQAGGGEIRDQEDRPFLDVARLSAVLDFYQHAEQTELMPYWLTQFQNDDQVWQAFLEERSDMVVTWTSHYLTLVYTDTTGSPEIAFAPLPTPDGEPFTLATGWVWALASPNQDQRILGLELAEFLCEANFLARWTEALGYLPPRSNALGGWSDTEIQPLVSQVLRSALLYPSTDISTPLGAALQQAVIQVLKEQNDPLTAAQSAADDLSGP